jgi:hypothetical protein
MATNRIGTVTNLNEGGTYDVLLVKVEGEFPEGKVNFALYDVPMKITGLQKVVQTFLKCLLTSKGSDVFYPERGTFFPTLTVNANVLVDDPTLLSEISDTIKDASTQTRNALNVNTTDTSSALDSVELLGLDKISEGVVLYLEARTLDGQYAAVAVPFPEFGLGTQ